ncbi:MAG: hypothetical protein JWL65_962 [Gammaproteobacteria bacterium]|nr:hypothetical protein [Gammaproteobacteria bacterium]
MKISSKGFIKQFVRDPDIEVARLLQQAFVNALAALRTLSGSNAVYPGFAPSSWAIGGTVGGNLASNVIGNANQ